jgi:hypothetical protein
MPFSQRMAASTRASDANHYQRINTAKHLQQLPLSMALAAV